MSYAPWDQWAQVITDENSNIYVLGEISLPGTPKYLWTAKYDPNGNILWEQPYTGTADESCYDGNLALMPDGGVVVTGQSWEVSGISIVTIRYGPDGTKLWQRLENAGYAHTSGDDVAVDTEGNIYVTGYGYNYSYWEDMITLGYSPDGDLLWTQIYAGPEPDQSDYPQAIAVDEAANVFVAGHSWDPETSNDFTTIMYSQAITAVDPMETPGVSTYSLSNNYPNPFNPSTNIKFTIPQTSFVTLEVFNSLGESVSVLVSKELSSGTYKYEFDASKLPSGFYFYQLQTPNFTQTKKMILLK